MVEIEVDHYQAQSILDSLVPDGSLVAGLTEIVHGKGQCHANEDDDELGEIGA